MIKTRTPDNIHQDISVMLANGVTYIEAIVEYAKNNELEIETVAEIIKKSAVIKEKIRQEAVSMKMVKNEDNRDITKLCQ
jgi:predicted aldo/keto reductase-like oxidoreductase